MQERFTFWKPNWKAQPDPQPLSLFQTLQVNSRPASTFAQK